MFKPKYTISILDSKWQPIKRNVKLSIIPRIDEFIFLDDQYHKVIGVVHTLNKTQDVFLIIEQMIQGKSVDNQIVKK